MRFLVWISDLLYGAYVLAQRLVTAPGRRRGMYVLLELSGPYPEQTVRGPWWSRRSPESVEEIRRRLAIIRANRAVAGIVLTVRDLEAGLASIQGLRAAFAAYRAAGGRIVAYLPQASTRVYYLASIADAIVMPESGTLDLVGATIGATFWGDALSRLGIAGEFEQFEEYKSAVEPFVRDSMSEPMREALAAVLDSVFEDMVTEVAAARRLSPDAVRRLIDRAPFSARDARDAGLVDALLFEDELPRYLAVDARPPLILPWPLARRRLGRAFRWRGTPGPAVAVVAVRGIIQMGESRPRRVPLQVPGSEASGHATVARAVRAVERDPRFGALVLSIDSPGGSALASDLIWREMERIGRRKPVVAFFGNVAASGGYYVAAGARRIVSHPGTLTGSIGVIAGKLTVRGLAERLGVHHEILARGAAATIASPVASFSADERQRVRAQAEECYNRFVDRVAAGRGLSRDAVLAAARGRVWTGRQARQLGLVDALGDFTAAVAEAKGLMGVPPSRDVPVVQIRPPKAIGLPRGGVLGLDGIVETLGSLLQERVLALMPWEIWLR